MKKFILAFSLLASSLAFAEPAMVFPRVINFGNSVQVQVYNNTPQHVTCSGSVFITLNSGRSYSEYYLDTVMPNFMSNRSFYVRDFRDQIRFVNHSIFCR